MTDYTELKRKAEKERKNNSAFVAAASPDVVLSMIAEIEQVKGLLMGALNQRDTLRTQNQALLEALKKISLTQYHIETPPMESLDEKMRNIARKAINLTRGKDA